MTNPTPPKALQDEIPEQLPEHQARVSRDSALGGHMCSCGYGYPGIDYEEYMRHYVREMSRSLAAARSERDTAIQQRDQFLEERKAATKDYMAARSEAAQLREWWLDRVGDLRAAEARVDALTGVLQKLAGLKRHPSNRGRPYEGRHIVICVKKELFEELDAALSRPVSGSTQPDTDTRKG